MLTDTLSESCHRSWGASFRHVRPLGIGIGFPRPPCQRISPLSDHQEHAAVPPLFPRRRSPASSHSFVLLFTPGEILLNVWRRSYDIPCSPTFLTPSLPFKPTSPLPPPPSPSPSLPSLFFSRVLMSLSAVFSLSLSLSVSLLFFPEEGRGIMLSPYSGRPALSCL